MTIDASYLGAAAASEPAPRPLRKRIRRWSVIALILVGVGTISGSWGMRIVDGQADARFVEALRADDPQEWLLNMTDSAVATSGRTECAEMQAGADPQARIDFYTTMNGAYLVNDAMQYLCPEQLAR